MVKVGIIGGSGLDDPDILKDAKEVAVKPLMVHRHLFLPVVLLKELT